MILDYIKYLNVTPKAQSVEENIDKLAFVKILSFCSAKTIVKKMKRQATDWEKIFGNHISNKGLGSRIFILKYLKLYSKKRNNPIKSGQI